MPSISQAKVKSVLSGDTLVLSSIQSPTQERTLSLAFVSAPRLRREGDEVSVSLLSMGVAGVPTSGVPTSATRSCGGKRVHRTQILS